ncbi:hypothetical protein [Streptomyces sp.]|uniref:hypothetical protein n=1 Tax=Streptomyces sp. TaxID=1931 RepID=UPI002F95CC43
MIDHLPRTSAFASAVAQDDELAAELGDPPKFSHIPPLTEWTPEVQALAAVVDRLAEVANAVVAAAGGNPSRVRPWPRPVTAFDRARTKRHREAADDMVTQLFPANPEGA